jgi:hypothetical protein
LCPPGWSELAPAQRAFSKGGVVRKLVLRMLFLLGGLVAGLGAGLLLPTAQRLRISRELAARIGRVAELMPDG